MNCGIDIKVTSVQHQKYTVFNHMHYKDPSEKHNVDIFQTFIKCLKYLSKNNVDLKKINTFPQSP